MKKALVTGCSGFVGGYLKKELEANGYTVVGTSRIKNKTDSGFVAAAGNAAPDSSAADDIAKTALPAAEAFRTASRENAADRAADIATITQSASTVSSPVQNKSAVSMNEAPDADGFIQIDMLDADSVRTLIDEQRPDYIFHLAGQADVGRSWKEPQLTFETNVTGTINLLEAVRAVTEQDTECRHKEQPVQEQFAAKELLGNQLKSETAAACTAFAASKLTISGSDNKEADKKEADNEAVDNDNDVNIVYSPRILIIGSSDEYGSLGKNGENVTEETPLAPGSPYAVSKLAQENIARVYVKTYGMDICMTRSFNHAGPGQREGFVLADFCSAVARIEQGMQDRLRIGNTSSRRDFTHVRDVVRAYRLILERGRAGEVYNVGSGESHDIQELLDKLTELSEVHIAVETDPLKMRPSDTPVICCNHDKLTRDTGWEPQTGFEQIIRETLDYFREKYRKSSD